MINVIKGKRYCSDDLSLIENFAEANNDPFVTWVFHHRKETDLGVSEAWLREMGLYFNRPASELILLKPEDHKRLHMKMFHSNTDTSGENNAFYGKKHSEESLRKMSVSRTKYYICPLLLIYKANVLKMTHQAIADELGCKRRTVTAKLLKLNRKQ